MKSILQVFTFLSLGIPFLLAQEAAPHHPKTNIFIEMQIVSIPREIAMPLVRDLMEKEKIEPAYLRIQDLLEKGTAKLVAWPIVTTQSKERGVFEAIEEFRYASEYLPGVIDFYSAEGKTPDGADLTKLNNHLDEVQFNGTPAAFETRNIGVTLEVQPVLSDDETTITMDIVPEHIVLKRVTKATVEKEKTHEKIVVEQPQFDTMKSTTHLVLKSGQRILMGVYPAPETPDHLELFILRAEVRKVQ